MSPTEKGVEVIKRWPRTSMWLALIVALQLALLIQNWVQH